MVQTNKSNLEDGIFEQKMNPSIDPCGGVPNGKPSEFEASFSLIMSHLKNIEAEDVAIKLQSIVNENLELKETVAQNNLAIRQQLTLLMQWNQQVQQQQQQYRQHFSDSNDHITALQRENSMLMSKIENQQHSSGSHGILDERDLKSIKERLESTTVFARKTKEENKILLDQKARLEGDITLLKCDLSTSRSEFEKLHQQQIKLVTTVKELQQVLQKEQLKSSYGTPTTVLDGFMGGDFDGYRDDIISLKRKLEKEQDVSTNLQLQLQKKKDEAMHSAESLELARKELSEYKIKCLQHEMANVDISVSSPFMDKKLIDAEKRRLMEEAAMLREEVSTLEIALRDERSRSSDERTSLSRMHSEVARLKKELLDAGENSERNKLNDHYYQAKLKSIHEQHDEATAKLISYEELLGSKNDEIARLKKEYGEAKAKLMETNSEGDLIAVLRAQVEVYQGDFRAEREAREQMATDREKLRDEIRHLHARNIQLMDELENYQRRQFPHGSNHSSRSASEEPVTANTTLGGFLSPESIWEKLSISSDKKEEPKKTQDIDETLLYCPKCNKSFTELRPLEEHVNRCLDED